MITPRFGVTQTDGKIIIAMKLKCIKTSECEFYIEHNLFKFYCKPYFLRLELPCQIVEDGTERAHYDVEKGELKVEISKKIYGQYFENLDILSSLLSPYSYLKPLDATACEMVQTKSVSNTHIDHKGEKADDREQQHRLSFDGFDAGSNQLHSVFSKSLIRRLTPSIEVIDSHDETVHVTNTVEGPSDFLFDSHAMRAWFCASSSYLGYGFLNKYRGYFKDFYTSFQNEYKWWLLEAIDNPDPEGLTIQQRHEHRIEKENQEFDVDHYLADLFEPAEEFRGIMKYETVWNIEWRQRKIRKTKNSGNNQNLVDRCDKSATKTEKRNDCIFTNTMETVDGDIKSNGRDIRSINDVGTSDSIENTQDTRSGNTDDDLNDVKKKGEADISSININPFISATTENQNESIDIGLENKGDADGCDTDYKYDTNISLSDADDLRSSEPAYDEYTASTSSCSLFSRSAVCAQILRKLPRREYLHTPVEEWACFLSLIDLVFVYAFNHRTCEGENSTESYWNVVKLSATLSWFDLHYTVQQVLVSNYRRALCYPLYRSWALCQKVCRDVIQIFSLGRCALLCCLLELKYLCDSAELGGKYLTQLYLDDYAVWIQKVQLSKIKTITRILKETYRAVSKEDLGFELQEMERMAQETMNKNKIRRDGDLLCE